tara:strand:- start:859 stop:1122 length:264 start_codon:yes stop_codon:yes gene_type:complete
MISFSEEDLEVKLAYKDYNSLPQRIMMKRWEDCDRDVFKFWDSIEWDSTWLRHDTEEEKYAKDVTREFNRHPFRKFISKPKEYLDVI